MSATATVERSLLVAAVRAVLPALRGKTPTARSVELTVAGDGLRLRARGPDLELWRTVAASTTGEASTLVYGRTLRALVADVLSESMVEVRVGQTLSLDDGITAVTPETADPSDYPPPVHSAAGATTVKLTAADVAMARRVASSADHKAERPALAAVCLDGADVVATDIYRLAVGPLATPVEGQVRLPVALVAHLPTEGTEVAVDESWAVADGAAGLLGPTDQPYPDWRPLFRGDREEASVSVVAAPLLATLRAAMTTARALAVHPRVTLTVGQSLRLSMAVNGTERYSSSVPATPSGDLAPHGLNAMLLADAVRALSGP
ncbi:MAG: hypothetical protein LC792_06520, partial [Actinobacteria bacterium]|nr:hypothetical protein [Actinomycetota bacterium]